MGAQGDAVADRLLAGLVDAAGFGELRAAVQHTVAHSLDLVDGFDDTVDRIHQDLQNGGHGLGMGGHGDVVGDLDVLFGDAVGQSAVDADALAKALGEDVTGVRIHQLILEGRAACVDD